LVVDGQAAIVGGTNIANEYYAHGNKPEDRWRDQDVLLVGPVVADVARAFDDNYEYFKLRREGRLPTNRAAWFARAWWEIAGAPPPVDQAPPPGRFELAPVQWDADPVTVRFIRHRPRRQEDYIFQAYLHLIESAQQSILIENAYFVPNRTLLNALMRAAKRGVKVTVITNSLATNDVAAMQVLSRYAYLGLAENGVAVYEWQGEEPGKGCLHTKAAVFDGQVTVIGSCNLDPRSLGINSEDVVLIDSAAVAGRLTDYVEKTDLPVSARVTLAQAREWHAAAAAQEKFKLTFGKALEDWF
jgi:putative cardiolipin synthase